MRKQLKLAQIFNDQMVFQQGEQIPVWGKSEDTSIVKVEFCGQRRVTSATKGEWFVTFLPAPVGGPYEMRITCGKEEILLKDIMVGEVWIAGGQSNMEFVLEKAYSGKDEIPVANYPLIRYFDVPRVSYLHPETEIEESEFNKNGWKVCTPENSGSFSAVAYHFAKDLYQDTQVPIGIIGCNWAGTSASCWMKESYLSQDEELRVYLDEYQELLDNLDLENYENELEKYDINLDNFSKRNGLKRNPDELGCIHDFPEMPPLGPKTFLRPCSIYHTMLHTIIPYSVKGVIWYQGEGDLHRAELYKKLFTQMIQNWRDDWRKPKLLFLFVQLTVFDSGKPEGVEWAKLREAQAYVMEEDPNTFMAVSIDVGDPKEIHPRNKKPVGERLALLARGKIYGQDILCMGPLYKDMKIVDNKIILNFDYAEKGLISKGGDLKGFKICGGDKVFVDAKAEILGNSIEVYKDGMQKPIAVRYGWADCVDVNLYNKEGLPASPFRTDEF